MRTIEANNLPRSFCSLKSINAAAVQGETFESQLLALLNFQMATYRHGTIYNLKKAFSVNGEHDSVSWKCGLLPIQSFVEVPGQRPDPGNPCRSIDSNALQHSSVGTLTGECCFIGHTSTGNHVIMKRRTSAVGRCMAWLDGKLAEEKAVSTIVRGSLGVSWLLCC